MTIVYAPAVIEIGDRHTRQLSPQEMYSIVSEVNKMFGPLPENSQAFQSYLDRYCLRKGIKPLLITDIIL